MSSPKALEKLDGCLEAARARGQARHKLSCSPGSLKDHSSSALCSSQPGRWLAHAGAPRPWAGHISPGPRPQLPRPQDGRCMSSGALSKVGMHSQEHKLFMTLETGCVILCDLLVRRPQVLYLGFVVVSGVGLMTESIIPKSSFGRPTKII